MAAHNISDDELIKFISSGNEMRAQPDISSLSDTDLLSMIPDEELMRLIQDEKPQKIAPGFFESIGHGAKHEAKHIMGQAKIAKELLSGNKPEAIPYEPTPEMGFNREYIGNLIGRLGVGSVPGIVGMGGGAKLGSMAGSVAGPVGSGIGALGGGITGGASVMGLQALADAYNEALLSGKSHEEALDYAEKSLPIGVTMGALSAALGPLGAGSNLVKHVGKQLAVQTPLASAQTIGMNALAKSEGIDENRELLSGLPETMLSSTLGTAGPVIVGRIARPGLEKLSSKFKKSDLSEIPNEKLMEIINEELPTQERTPYVEPMKMGEKEIQAHPEPMEMIEERSIESPAMDAKHIAELKQVKQSISDPEYRKYLSDKIFGSEESLSLFDKAKNVIKDISDNPKGYISKAGDYLSHQLFNEYGVISRLGKELGIKDERENVALRQAKFSRHTTGVLEAVFYKGLPKWDAESGIITLDLDRPGLLDRLRPIYQTPELKRDWMTYAYARRVHGQELIQKGKERNINLEETNKIMELENTHPEFKKVFDDVQEFKRRLLEIGEQTDILDPQLKQKFIEDIDYIPFYRKKEVENTKSRIRIGSKSSLAGQSLNIKKLTGGPKQWAVYDEDGVYINRYIKKSEAAEEAKKFNGTISEVGSQTEDLISNLSENTAGFIQAAMRNAAANTIVKYALEAGDIVQPATKADYTSKHNKKDIIKIKVKGKDEFYKIEDPELFDALTSTITPSVINNKIITGMEWFKNTFSKSILLDPTVQFSIWVKDYINSRMMGRDPIPLFKGAFSNLHKAIKHTYDIENDPRASLISAMGADAGYYETDPKSIVKRAKEEFSGKDVKIYNPKELIKTPSKVIEFLNKLGKAGELQIRLDKYDAAVRTGATIAEAGFEALDYMDYKSQGASDTMRFLGKTIPFWTAHVASLNKLGRELIRPPETGKFLNRTQKMILGMWAISMINSAINTLPEENDELAANDLLSLNIELRNSNFLMDLYKYGKVIGVDPSSIEKSGLPRYIGFPKNWALGALTMTLPEQIVYGMRGDKDLSDHLNTILNISSNQLAINPLGNPFFKVPMEEIANKELFTDRPIVPRAKENLSPSLQTAKNTSPSFEKIGKELNISPARLEHITRGFLGTTYLWPIWITDIYLNHSGPDKPKEYMTEQKFINKFFKSGIPRNNAYQQEFYDMYRDAEKSYLTAKHLEDIGDIDALKEHIKNKKNVIGIKKDLDTIRGNLKLFNENIDYLYNSDLSAEQKRKDLDKVYKQRNKVLYKFHKLRKKYEAK